MAGTTVNKIDSNATDLRFSEELCPGMLVSDVAGDGDRSVDIWYPQEPNSYDTFGGDITTVSRNPINQGRQRKKGTAVGIEAAAGYQDDLTQESLQRKLRGFMFADFREKADINGFSREVKYDVTDGTVDLADISVAISSIASDEYVTATDPTSTNSGRTRPFAAGMLIHVSGMLLTANNGLKTIASVDSGGITTDQTLTNDAAAQTAAEIVEVGYQFDTGDLDVDASSGFPVLTTTTKDLTELGIIPGEWIFVGGDSAGLRFTNAANNGFKRVRSVSANAMVLDKSTLAMVTEANTTSTVQVFTGRVIKNEKSRALQVTRSYQFELKLGYSNGATPTNEQASYVGGAFANEITFNYAQKDKVTLDFAYVATNNFTLDENDSVTLRSKEAVADGSIANTPAIVEADPFNTSSDISRIALTLVEDGVENATPLFTYLQELTATINNNITPAEALGVFGAFDVNVGNFDVDAEMTAYFNSVAGIAAVRNSSDVSFDIHLVKQNAGISMDMPLITLGGGQPNIALNEAVTLPITNEAAEGSKVDAGLDHTLLFVFFPYLPTLADA